ALPAGQRGQAGVRGPSLFLGYAQGLGDGSAQFAPGGYLLTGDEIVCQPDGYMKVVGRIKDQIIRGGFNIDPAEVETAIRRHPGIADAVVVSVPHPRLVEQCCAVCRMLPGAAPLDLAALLEHLGGTGLSKKKWPEHLLVVDSIAQSANDKPDKKAIAAMARERLGLGG
ncbi:MAG: acyl--CoA ligase, partial [Sphingomonadales bacterium]|nr:acyl--CoA ligase [Sphingomonadales bacterium]